MTVAVPFPTASITHLFCGNSRTRNSMMSSFVGIRLSNLREYWRKANAISLELLGRADRSRRPYRQGCRLPVQIENLFLQSPRGYSGVGFFPDDADRLFESFYS